MLLPLFNVLPFSKSIPNIPALLLPLPLIVIFGAPAAQAQMAQQVPLDAEGTVSVIDAELRERLGLFPEVEGFVEARLFRSGRGDNAAYELVIRYTGGQEENRLRERRALSGEEVEALRRRVSRARAEEQGPLGERAPLEGGRYRFLAATTLLGATEGTLFAVAAGGGENEDVLTAAPLLGATAGFFVPLLLTREARVTEAEATLTGYGGAQGFAHGVALSALFADEDFDGRGAAALTGVLVGAEAAGGLLFARRRGLRGGPAEATAIGGSFGTGLGVAAGFLAIGSDGEAVQRVVPLASIAGSAAGAYGGHRLGRAAGYTQGDARVFGTAGVVGTQLAIAALIVADRTPGDDTRTASGAILAGALGGLALGHGMVKDRDFGEAQGSIISLGAYAGSLAGGAVGTIADVEEDTGILLSALGAVGGFAGTYLTYRGEAQAREGQGGARLQLGVGPGAALRGGEGGPLGALTPALSARLTF